MKVKKSQIGWAHFMAELYHNCGWCPIPVPGKNKAPRLKDWPDFKFRPDDRWSFRNVGVLLGEMSSGLVDVDLDATEALRIGPDILPNTPLVFGRRSKPRSHYLYRIPDLSDRRPVRYNDPETGDTIIELRFSHNKNNETKSLQTIFPPSIHPCGEYIEWEDFEKFLTSAPREIGFTELISAIGELAGVVTLARRWKEGSRHDIALGLGGMLAKGGMDSVKSGKLTRHICFLAGDEEVEDRIRAVYDSYKNLKKGQPTSGIGRLTDLLGDKIVQKVIKWLELEGIHNEMNQIEVKHEPPKPLIRELPPGEPFPTDSLISSLSDTIDAIQDVVRVPAPLAAGSVLATACLAVQGFADVVLPIGKGFPRPLSQYFLTIAESSDRKSTADEQAIKAVREHERELEREYRTEMKVFANRYAAYEKKKGILLGKAGKDTEDMDNEEAIEWIAEQLNSLGEEPVPPLKPFLVVEEPTFPALCQLLRDGRPSVGLFSAEGGQIIFGYGLREDRKLATAAGLSALWDGVPLKRSRIQDGHYSLPGRRCTLHLMVQPIIAHHLLSDTELLDQGVLSRFLVTAPASLAGTRLRRNPKSSSIKAIELFKRQTYKLLNRDLPLVDETRNELDPRWLQLSQEAVEMWFDFADEIEREIARGKKYEQIKSFAGKAQEHAARLAGVMTLFENFDAQDIPVSLLSKGIKLVRFYLAEGLRLFYAGKISKELAEAERLLAWLHKSWPEQIVSIPDCYQRGPNSVRDKATAERLVQILVEHGWLIRISGGARIRGKYRRQAWRIVESKDS